MFNLFTKKPAKSAKHGKKVVFNINGMHCVSCSMNIDGELEELDGVISSTTNYAKSTSVVEFDSDVVQEPLLAKTIEKLGYSVTDSKTS